mgnify:CR=1 FL=1
MEFTMEKTPLFRDNLNKIILVKIADKKDKIMSFKANIKMESGKKEK